MSFSEVAGSVATRLRRRPDRTAAKRGNGSNQVFRNSSMTRNSQERRTPEQIRASNRRIGLVLLAIAAVFFASVIINQGWFS
ncbi:hypothetical protein BWU74_02815 [Paraburkholderia caledonica]|nr:hypothetical protein BWU74_02815 [Burkholderia sp. Bk]